MRRLLSALVVLLVGAPFVASSEASADEVVTFTAPGAHEWVVPDGTHCVVFELVGASGGLGAGATTPASPALGGHIFLFAGVQPGMTFDIHVGGRGGDASGGTGGAGGVNGGAAGGTSDVAGGGGGGGASDVRVDGTSLADRYVVAGGGGGSGALGADAAPGGLGTKPGDERAVGGDGTGGSGGDSGGASAGGAGGVSVPPGTLANDGVSGASGTGGAGGDGTPQGGGGGGGGGYFGGGGGAASAAGASGGGGGGASYLPLGYEVAVVNPFDPGNQGNGVVKVTASDSDYCLGARLVVAPVLDAPSSVAPGTSVVANVHCFGYAFDLAQFGGFGLTNSIDLEYVVGAGGALEPVGPTAVRIWRLDECVVTATGLPGVPYVIYSCTLLEGSQTLCHEPGPTLDPITFTNFFINQIVRIDIHYSLVPPPPPVETPPVIELPVVPPGNVPPPVTLQPTFTG